MTMQIQAVHGIWYLVEVNGETHYVPPGLCSLGIASGDGYTRDSLREATPSSEVGRFASGLLAYVQDGNVVEVRPCGFINEVEEAAYAEADAKWAEMLAAVQPYVGPTLDVDGDIEITAQECWGAQYHMPGCMDQTDWCLGDTEAEAVADCKNIYGDEDADGSEEE